MRERGFIKLARQMLSWEWYSDINVTRVFIHLLLNATYKDYPYQGLVIPRGGQITTHDKLAGETGLTKSEVRGAISKLKSTGEITTEITRNKQLIRLCNYSAYQDKDEAEPHPKPHAKPHPNHTRLTSDQHPYIEQEDKKIRIEEDIPPSPPKKKSKKSKSKPKPEKMKFAELVTMTNDEYTSLVERVGEDGAKSCIEILDNYKGAHGKKYKSDYRAILSWVVKRYQEDKSKAKHNSLANYQNKPSNPFLREDL